MPSPRLHIFNPDTDYALASGRRYYTPPARVIELRRQLAFTPLQWALEGDAILLLDSPAGDTNYFEALRQAEQLGVEVFDTEQFKQLDSPADRYSFDPWGWNLSIRQFLRDFTGSDKGLPTEEDITILRNLSHRRSTRKFLNLLPSHLTEGLELPEEITDTEEAVKAFRRDRNRYFKAPWSSSGRGILLTDDLEEKHVEPWIRGIIRHQGSVIMEKAYKRILDFATEWICDSGRAEFLGFSVFRTSRRGKYHGNEQATQPQLKAIIQEKLTLDADIVVRTQKEAIEHLIAPVYSGPIGIDMLVTEEGKVNPCVEINLRHTMGMTELLKQYRLSES